MHATLLASAVIFLVSCAGDDQTDLRYSAKAQQTAHPQASQLQSAPSRATELSTPATQVTDLRGRYLVFSLKFQTRKSNVEEEWLRIGYLAFGKDGTAEAWYMRYRPKVNHANTLSVHQHGPLCSAASQQCDELVRTEFKSRGLPTPSQSEISRITTGLAAEGGAIRIPTPDGEGSASGKWTFDGSTLLVTFGQISYEWQFVRNPATADEHFRLISMFGVGKKPGEPVLGTSYLQVEGYGYPSDEIRPSAVKTADISLLNPENARRKSYRAHSHHNNAFKQGARWNFLDTTLNAHYYSHKTADRNVATSLAYGCGFQHPNTGRASGPMFCGGSMLFNQHQASPLIFHIDQGHDYSGDHKLNENNHHLTVFAAWVNGRVNGMVWIEHSWQYECNNSYPMLSVGRYFANHDLDTRLSAVGVALDGRTPAEVVAGNKLRLSWTTKHLPAGARLKFELWRGPVWVRSLDLVVRSGTTPAEQYAEWTVPAGLGRFNPYRIQAIASLNGAALAASTGSFAMGGQAAPKTPADLAYEKCVADYAKKNKASK